MARDRSPLSLPKAANCVSVLTVTEACAGVETEITVTGTPAGSSLVGICVR